MFKSFTTTLHPSGQLSLARKPGATSANLRGECLARLLAVSTGTPNAVGRRAHMNERVGGVPKRAAFFLEKHHVT